MQPKDQPEDRDSDIKYYSQAHTAIQDFFYWYGIVKSCVRATPRGQVGNNAPGLVVPSLLIPQGKCEITGDDLKKVFDLIKESDTLEIMVFIGIWSTAEAFLKRYDDQPKLSRNVWNNRPRETLSKPSRFWLNWSFEDNIDFHEQATAEMRASRNAYQHRGGIVDQEYLANKRDYFPRLADLLGKLPPEMQGVHFRDDLLARLNLSEGARLKCSSSYLAFAGMIGIDRLLLNSGLCAKLWAEQEPHFGYEFELLPPFHRFHVFSQTSKVE